MASTPIRSPVVVDGVVNREKVAQLLSLGAEYPELDFKSRIDPGEKAESQSPGVGSVNTPGSSELTAPTALRSEPTPAR
jgi:hypothetical protein